MPPKAAPKPAAKPAGKPAAKAAAKAPAKAATPAAAPKAAAPKATGNGVHVKGLGRESVADVRNIFQAAGTVTNVRLRRFKYALVWFDSNAAAQKAIASFNGKKVNGRQVSVAGAKASPAADKKTTAVTVFVGPIFRQMTNRAQVRGLFKDCGKITALRTYRLNYALVRFDSNAAVQKAITTVHRTMYRNKRLTVKASTQKPGKN